MKEMRLIVCGSRTVKDRNVVYFCLDRLAATLACNSLMVITGGARGADALAHDWARDRGHETVVVPANWELNGKMAGFVRNEMMMGFCPDIVFGFFQNHQTTGTLDMLQRGKNAGVDTRYVVIK